MFIKHSRFPSLDPTVTRHVNLAIKGLLATMVPSSSQIK
jgi:hypothetical protein